MNCDFDLAVIGAGPAGTSAAITAARLGHRVVLLERGLFPRHKVCGEFVSPEALHLLHELLPDSTWPEAPSIRSARIFADGKVRQTAISPVARSIPRFALDTTLWEQAGHDGVLRIADEAVMKFDGGAPFRITTRRQTISARAVINAAGRWSVFNATPLPAGGTGLGLKRHYHEPSPNLSVDLYFFAGGYCGVQPVGPDTINVSAVVWGKKRKCLEDVFAAEPALLRRSSAWLPVTEPVSTYPLLFRRPNPVICEHNILNVGDAAGFIDPFVGDGISMALHGGRFAAQSLSAFLRGEAPLKEAALSYAHRYRQQLLPAFSSAARLRRFASSPALRGIALELFRIPAVSRFALRSTRVRAA